MDNVPQTPEEYRLWWIENTDVPYGYCWCGCGKKTGVQRKTNRSAERVKGEPVRWILGHRARQAPPMSETEHKRWWLQQVPHIPYGCCWCGCGEETSLSGKTSLAEYSHKGMPRRYVGPGHSRRLSPNTYSEEERGYHTPCWVWQRSLSTFGYGKLWEEGRLQPAHRVYYERKYGSVPQGLELDHLCTPFGGPKNCVNPDHVEPVTHTENIRRGRKIKLSLEKARQIRYLHCNSHLTNRQIGEIFDVSDTLISNVVQGKIWRDDD